MYVTLEGLSQDIRRRAGSKSRRRAGMRCRGRDPRGLLATPLHVYSHNIRIFFTVLTTCSRPNIEMVAFMDVQ